MDQRKVLKRLGSGAFYAFLSMLLTRGTAFISGVIVAKELGLAEYGQYSFIQITVLMFTTFCAISFAHMATRFVSEHKSNTQALNNTVSVCMSAAWLFGMLLSLAMVIGGSPIATLILNDDEAASNIMLAAPLVLIGLLNSVQNGLFAGFEYFRILSIANMWTSPLVVILSYYGSLYFGIKGAILGMLIYQVVVYFVCRQYLQKIFYEFKIIPRFKFSDWEIVWKNGFPSAISGLLTVPVSWVTISFLANARGGYEAVGIYNAANQWRLLLITIPGVVGNSFLPIATNIKNNNAEYRKFIFISIALVSSIVAIVGLPIFVYSEEIMAIYGDAFVSGDSALRVLIFCAVITSIVTLQYRIATANDAIHVIFYSNLAWAIVCVICSWYLKNDGAYGLAVANFYAFATQLIVACSIFFIDKFKANI